MSFVTPEYPGVQLDDDQGPEMNSVSVAFIALSFSVLALRLVSRLVTRVPFGTDDWLILVAAVSVNKVQGSLVLSNCQP